MHDGFSLTMSDAGSLAKKNSQDNGYDSKDDPFLRIEVDLDSLVLVLDLKIVICGHRYSSHHHRI